MQHYNVYKYDEILEDGFDLQNHTSNFDAPTTVKKSYIYFLVSQQGEIVYIGQSIYDPIFRVFKHQLEGKKDFAYFRGILVSRVLNQELLNNLETELILKHKPKYNKALPKNNKWVSMSNIKIALDVSQWCITKAMKGSSIELDYKEFNGKKYYSVEQVKSII